MHTKMRYKSEKIQQQSMLILPKQYKAFEKSQEDAMGFIQKMSSNKMQLR